MKLRIRGNSIRLRLLKSEVELLSQRQRVEETIVFGPTPQEKLTYAIEVSEHSDKVSAGMCNGELCVTLPADVAKEWTGTERVGIEAAAEDANGNIEITVEKDFVCLTRVDDPDNKDAYPNPDSEKEC